MNPDSVFGSEWTLGDDGLLFRRGARILMFDTDDRLLLIRGHDWGKNDRSWWFTVGGGYGEEEDPLDGVMREALEETGITLERSQVIGPVGSRSAIFDFALRTVRQDEVFFVAHGVAGTVEPAALSDIETELLDEFRWWDLDELEDAQQAGETIYPLDLVSFARTVRFGWDGEVRRLSSS